MSSFNDRLMTILKSDESYIDEHGELLKNKILNNAVKNDEILLRLLISNNETKNYFFDNVDEYYIFDQNKFINFISKNCFINSFTKFKNKVGLNINKKYLNELDEVSLVWPFKDCILEAGMNKDDKENRKEIFFNETLAKDEIDRLLDPKVLSNIICYGKNPFSKNLLDNNFLIKGNNLLVLHSLLSSFRNKIKLIYIDPPYNTKGEEDTFTYNNTFKESTWLTFMKNRLEVSRDLLRNDGFIAMAINHAELFYLGILADEIFGRDNRVGLVSVIHKPEGVQHSKFFSPSHEFMIVYAKNKHLASFNKVVLSEEKLKQFNQKDKYGRFKWKNYIRSDNTREKSPNRYYPIYVSKDFKTITLDKHENYYEVYPIGNNGIERVWITVKETFLERLNNDEIRAVYDNINKKVKIEYKIREQQVLISHWTEDKYYKNEEIDIQYDSESYSTLWEDKSNNATSNGTNLVNKLISSQRVSYPKSLYTVMDTLKIMTNKDDIILDFFSGSGTTGHATLKLNKEDMGNRQFILVEQLEQHNNVAIERLVNVIKKENIEDNFIYCELTEYNEKAINKIVNAKDLNELINLWNILCEKYFLNYYVDIFKINENIEEFKLLSFNDQKKILIECLNKNQLYINLSEIDDIKFNIDKSVKQFNRNFYINEVL